MLSIAVATMAMAWFTLPLAGLPPSAVAAAAACSWTQFPTPAVDPGNATLTAVHAVGHDDVWAVGYGGTYPDQGFGSLAVHYDGSAWTVFPTPSEADQLSSVDGVSSDDVWAVGGSTIEHWDGSTWTATTNVESARLLDVAAIGADDAWVVGDGHAGPFATHWDGSTWTAVPTPAVSATDAALTAVSAGSADDVWAVGHKDKGLPLFEHWDGTRWRIVPSASGVVEVTDVAAVSATEAWAVGGSPYPSKRPSLERWDGTRWARTSPSQLTTKLLALDRTPSGDVWAAGTGSQEYYIHPGPPGTGHFDGSSWTAIFARGGGTRSFNTMAGVSALAADDVWAVGWSTYDTDFGPNHPLAQHWNGRAWGSVPVPAIGASESFTGVAAADPSRAWAIGHSAQGMLLETWNGRSWMPIFTGGDRHLDDIAAADSRHAWVVGGISGGSGGDVDYPEALYWNGTEWGYAGVDMPPAGEDGAWLDAVSASSPTDAWAVGWTQGGDGQLVQRWTGSQWTHVEPANVPGARLSDVLDVGPRNVWVIGNVGFQPSHPVIEHWDGVRFAG